MKLLLLAPLALLLLAGCQANTFDLKDDTLFQQTIPVCTTDAECKAIWQAAREWVMQATPQGLEIDTDQRLQTWPADVESIDWETDIIVNKVPLGDGKYQIVIETLCNTNFNKCGNERQLMRQFNKDMAAHVSSSQSQEILRIFSEGDDMDTLFSSFTSAISDDELRQHAQKYYLPATIIRGDNVRQLTSTDDVIAFLRDNRRNITNGEVARIELKNRRLLSSNKTSAIVMLRWDFYDASDELLYSQKATYNLIKVGKGWKILSVSFDE